MKLVGSLATQRRQQGIPKWYLSADIAWSSEKRFQFLKASYPLRALAYALWKSERNCASVEMAFVPFGLFWWLWCKGSLVFVGCSFPGTARKWWSARQSWVSSAPSDWSQFRARCFRQSSTRISAALAKATVLCITGTPSACPAYLSCVILASNFRGPADVMPCRPALK